MRIFLFLVLCRSLADAQMLPLPQRDPSAPGGKQFCSIIHQLPRIDREETIFHHVAAGNIPDFLRRFVPITVTDTVGGRRYTLVYFVTPDYLAVGTDTDYVLMPMTPLLAQKIADRTECMLPTPAMVDQIYRSAAVKLPPQPIPPDAAMDKVPRFSQHNDSVQSLRRPLLGTFPPGALVGGTKKDVVIDKRIFSWIKPRVPKPVVIYGWHQLNGVPIQPAYNGHGETYADYSHGIRLVRKNALINGAEISLSDILRDQEFSPMISDTILAEPRYPLPSEKNK